MNNASGVGVGFNLTSVTDSDEDSSESIHFFVPGENINAAILVDYISRQVDPSATIRSASHPTVSKATVPSFLIY